MFVKLLKLLINNTRSVMDRQEQSNKRINILEENLRSKPCFKEQ